MHRSDNVEEVLDSKEFKTWMSEGQIEVDLDNWSSYGTALLMSMTFASVFTSL